MYLTVGFCFLKNNQQKIQINLNYNINKYIYGRLEKTKILVEFILNINL